MSYLGCLLGPDELRTAVALRVGANIFGGARTRCRCGKWLDIKGLHGLSCRLNAGRFARHSELNLVIKRALYKANVPCLLEPPGLSRDDGKRPDGVTLCPLTMGRSLVWDVTDAFAPGMLNQSAIEAGSAAHQAERRKLSKYAVLAVNYIIQPLAFETSGGYGPLTTSFLSTLSKKLAEGAGDSREGLWFRQRLSLAIVRGNAASVLACSPYYAF